MGGDHAPREVVAGAVMAARDHEVPLILVGPSRRIRALLAEYDAVGNLSIVHTDESLEMGEGALASWRKPRSTIAIACELMKHGKAGALVSAGSTAGVVATSAVRLKTQHGILRPAIAVTLPTRPRPTVLLDAGATADAKPEMLVQFALLGTAFAQIRLGVARPRVGLLTIGAEPGKGNKLTKKAHELLAASPLEFAGNIEGHDLLRNTVDVIVADGFTGNIALKTMEGTLRVAVDELKHALTSSRRAKLGAALQRRELTTLTDRFDSDTYGGGVLLGLNGAVVIAHGASRARAIAAACKLAFDLSEGKLIDRVREQLGSAARPSRFRFVPLGEREPKEPRDPREQPGDGA
ncbi:phosphate acyltransferase PlsX [Actinocorallia sp. API 0066]|uniref:phosphate acyltransferase PlsX n=1 Tax=Actinocorallia sp. API 0066 TaxID=2896846 RepID=UPI001E4947F0|nr:phosphate acyltransferase PlsX [Actinocorallia sp. API 0066]MCD0447714.1 phosphate acyltransferase PlsX [Actinocorallia sp. API 0066]